MNKKVVSIIAIIAIVAILGVCLVACNAESYQKKLEKAGYTVEVTESDDEDDTIVWAVSAISKENGTVVIAKYKTTDDAKAAEEDYAKITGSVLGVKMVCERQGKIVFYGTEAAVEDAK